MGLKLTSIHSSRRENFQTAAPGACDGRGDRGRKRRRGWRRSHGGDLLKKIYGRREEAGNVEMQCSSFARDYDVKVAFRVWKWSRGDWDSN
eukprot:762068-Hanusia_phi.AAC.1